MYHLVRGEVPSGDDLSPGANHVAAAFSSGRLVREGANLEATSCEVIANSELLDRVEER